MSWVIYEFPDESEPIRQGDIFYPLPITVLNLENMISISIDGDAKEIDWIKLQETDNELVITTKLEKTWGIVTSQDCDVARDDQIKKPLVSLFEIGPFNKVTGLSPSPNEDKFPNWITQQCHYHLKWFYLPIDSKIGFEKRMAANFQKVFQIRLSDLLKNIKYLRKGRLNMIAHEHYRECIAQYYRRYPYDEWYSLNKKEFEIYNKAYNNQIPPFAWQE